MGTTSSIQRFTSVRKLFSATIALLTVSTVLIGCTTKTETAPETAQSPAQAESSPANTTPETIRIGYVRWGLLPIVRQRGNLEQELAKQNIKVQWVGPFPAFAPVLEAFNAGEVDISAGGDIPGISGLVGGTPICIIAYQPSIPEAEAILVRSDSDIQSPQDLKPIRKPELLLWQYMHKQGESSLDSSLYVSPIVSIASEIDSSTSALAPPPIFSLCN